MKQILSLLLAAFLVSVSFSAGARKGEHTGTKTGNPALNKVMKTVAPDTAGNTGAFKPNNGPEDTASENFKSLFYTPKNKRSINIPDIFVGLGGCYSMSDNVANTPYNKGACVNASYGVPLLNKYLLAEINNNAEVLYSPDTKWYESAFSLPKESVKHVGTGFSNEFSLGLHVVILGSRNMTLTAGPLAGGKLTILPSMNINGNLHYLSTPFSICYGLKANLFIGRYFYCFGEYANSAAKSIVTYASQNNTSEVQQTVQHIPVNFGMLRFGAAYIFKPWW